MLSDLTLLTFLIDIWQRRWNRRYPEGILLDWRQFLWFNIWAQRSSSSFSVFDPQEISVLSQCRCPYITEYYGSYLHQTKLWIIMEYMAGGSVADLVCQLVSLQIVVRILLIRKYSSVWWCMHCGESCSLLIILKSNLSCAASVWSPVGWNINRLYHTWSASCCWISA